MAHMVRNAKKHNRAKFRGNRSKHDRHGDFSIFKMAFLRYLGFLKI